MEKEKAETEKLVAVSLPTECDKCPGHLSRIAELEEALKATEASLLEARASLDQKEKEIHRAMSPELQLEECANANGQPQRPRTPAERTADAIEIAVEVSTSSAPRCSSCPRSKSSKG